MQIICNFKAEKNMKKLYAIILILNFILLLSGCANSNTSTNGKKTIAVSIVPQATFVEKVCGDKFNIVTMIPPGASAESYEPTLKQMEDFEKADIYFGIGVPSEENSIIPNIKEETTFISLHTEVDKIYPDIMIDGERDPHIWLSPKRVSVMIEIIKDTLISADSENKDFYISNAKKYKEELSLLNKEIKGKFRDIKNRNFIALHPAFGYFADDYSLNMIAIEEHGKEADAKQIGKIADIAKKENIKTIFYQAEVSKRQADAFAEEIGGQAVCLNPLSADYTENIKKMAESIKKAMN